MTILLQFWGSAADSFCLTFSGPLERQFIFLIFKILYNNWVMRYVDTMDHGG